MTTDTPKAKSILAAKGKPLILLGALAIGLWVLVFYSISTSLPDDEIRVISFEPTGKIPLKANITIKFSKTMVTKDSIDKPVLDPPVIFTPPISGLARWIDTDVLRFFPDAELLPATAYTARVASDRTWECGLKIVNDDVYGFQTPGLRPTNVYLFAEGNPDKPGTMLIEGHLAFNYKVDLRELWAKMKIKGESGAARSSLRYALWPAGAARPTTESVEPTDLGRGPAYADDFFLVSEPFEQADEAQDYTIIIDKGLGCQNCGMAMAEPVVQTVRVEPRQPLVVQGIDSRSWGEESVVEINFSTPVTAEQTKEYITVNPPVEFTIEEAWQGVVLHGGFRPGATYTIDIGKGMPSKSGTMLQRDFSSSVTVADISPSISFTSMAVFLPREGNGLIEFKVINVNDIAVEVEQVFPNNIVYFLGSSSIGRRYYADRAGQLGRSIFIKDLSLEGRQNEPLITSVDIAGIIGDSKQGIFKVSVRAKEQRWVADSRFVMITDIGVSARISDNYFMVWANSLETGEPIEKAAVTLISKNNQVLLEGKTDSRGAAVFKDITDALTGFEPFVILVSRGGEMSYLRLDETLLPISDFDVAGRPYLSSGYEAYLYTERGVYRPGDTARIVSIVRGVNASMPPSFPYSLTIFDNQGRKHTSYRMTTDGSAVAALDFPVPDYAPTGKYAVAAVIGEDLQIGRAEFLVEEFIPDRIKVTLTPSATNYHAGETLMAGVNAKFLFGPPAAGHRVTGHLTLDPQPFAPAGWSQYTFGDETRSFAKMDIDFKDAQLDDTGGFTYTYKVPENLTPPSMLKGILSATVSEQGGRGVSAYAEVRIHPYDRYIGLKLQKEGYAAPGETVTAAVAALDPAGKPMAISECDVRLYRIVYNTVLKSDNIGIFRYVSEEKAILIDSTTMALGLEGGTASFVPTDYGRYRIVARDGKSGHSSSVTFYVSGWGYAPWAMTHPDRIELGLDKTVYEQGEKAVVQVRAPFGGRLMVTVEKTEVIDVFVQEMKENTAEIEIPIKREYFPNAYITATVIRQTSPLSQEAVLKTAMEILGEEGLDSIQEAAKTGEGQQKQRQQQLVPVAETEPAMPARAFGIVPLKLSTEERRLKVAMTSPEVIKPKTRVSVQIDVGQPRVCDVSLAAVDAGVLQLTEFATPDPMEFFYGKKHPGLKAHDLYSFIYPTVKKAQSHLAPGGDKMLFASRMRHISPITARRARPVALWSGLIKTNAEGKATVTFDVPEFNGTLSLMAVAVQNDRFGSAVRDLKVRDKIVIQESFPRFVSPHDQFDGLVTLFNNTGARADINVTLEVKGPAKVVGPATATVPLDDGREGSVIFKLEAQPAPGAVSFTLTAKGNGEESKSVFELPNRPAQPLTTLFGSGAATKDAPAEFSLPGDWLAGTDQYVLRTSTLPAASFGRQIQYLLQYPYGCVEQTTSRLFPLLYFNDLAKVVDPALFGTKGPQYFVQEGILRLQSMMLPDKSFAFWPGETVSNPWGTIYASHFLSEASRAGYYVDEKVLDGIYDHLKDIARGKRQDQMNNAHRIYAAYVLAKAGKLEQNVIGYLKSLDPPTGLEPYSRYQLAAALAISGNTGEATKFVPVDIQPNLFEPETGGNFNSGVRTDAILLDALLDVSPLDPAIPVLAGSLIERARVGKWYTTQDNAFALMALGRYFKSSGARGYTGTLTIEGEKAVKIDSAGMVMTRKDLAGKKATIRVTSTEGTCFYYWQASGIPLTPAAEEFNRGITIKREYLNEDALPVDINNVPLGSQVVAVITVESAAKPLSNVIISDLLPAGFEIENPRLKTTPRLSWIPKQAAPVSYQDIRDDRVLIFTDLTPGRKFEFYYSLRAISAGQFKMPPVSAECMYNPLVAGAASSGVVTVVR